MVIATGAVSLGHLKAVETVPEVSPDAILKRDLFSLLQRIKIDNDGRILPEKALTEAFVYPDAVMAYAEPLVARFKGQENRIDAIVGYGTPGAMLASFVAKAFQEMYKTPRSVIALSFEKGSDIREDLALGDAGIMLRNRRTVFVEPFLTPDVWPRVKACADVICNNRNLGSVCAVGTIIRFGEKPLGILSGCEVESLMEIKF